MNNPIRLVDPDGMAAVGYDSDFEGYELPGKVWDMFQGFKSSGVALQKKEDPKIVASTDKSGQTIVDNGESDPTKYRRFTPEGDPVKYRDGTVQNYINTNAGYPQLSIEYAAVFKDRDGNNIVFPNVSFTDQLTQDGGGFTPGTHTIHLSTTNNINGLIDLEHEYGHYLDSQIRGILEYTFSVSVPSLISAGSETQEAHLKRSYEQRATQLAIKFFGQNSALALSPSLYIKK